MLIKILDLNISKFLIQWMDLLYFYKYMAEYCQ